MTTPPIVGFLTARYKEVERAAKAWGASENAPWRQIADFILADLAAKRRILARHTDPDHFCGVGATWRHSGDIVYAGGQRPEPHEDGGACADLRDAASVFGEHPDYDPGWAPQGVWEPVRDREEQGHGNSGPGGPLSGD